VKAEDIGTVVMADRVEVAASGQDIAEVQVGDKGSSRCRTGPARISPLGATMTVLPSSSQSPFSSRYFARDMAHGGNPSVARRQSGRQPQVHSLRVHVEPGQRHVVLPADQAPDLGVPGTNTSGKTTS
jgi:hypothetical protein